MQILPKEKIADLANQVTPYDVVLFGKDDPIRKTENSNAPSGKAKLQAINSSAVEKTNEIYSDGISQ